MNTFNSIILKLKSNKKKSLMVIVVLVVILTGLVLALTLTRNQEEVVIIPILPAPEEFTLEKMEPGIEGELKEGEVLEEVNPEAILNPLIPPDVEMPAVVSDTKGEIISVEADGITIMGSGESFADQKPRILTIKLTSETIVFTNEQETRMVGLAGLKQLKPGDRVLVSSAENIRGKTEFTASHVNGI